MRGAISSQLDLRQAGGRTVQKHALLALPSSHILQVESSVVSLASPGKTGKDLSLADALESHCYALDGSTTTSTVLDPNEVFLFCFYQCVELLNAL